MAEVKLAAEVRTEFGKGAARRVRREDKVPAVVYGHGADPVHITLPGHELHAGPEDPERAASHLDIEGKNELVIPKAVQREAIRGFLEHVDLLVVKRGEKVNVEIPIHTEGELAPGGNLLEHVLNALPVEAEATHIPESVTVSIEGLDGRRLGPGQGHPLPKGTTLAVDEDAVVLQVAGRAGRGADRRGEAAEGEAEAAGRVRCRVIRRFLSRRRVPACWAGERGGGCSALAQGAH